jgi:hypothetical protein
MDNEHLREEIAGLLGSDAQLASMSSLPPRAMYIPFTKDRSSFFLLVSLCLWPHMKTYNDLAYASLAALRLIIPSGLLRDLAGIEIALYIFDGEKSDRIMRLSVQSKVFEKAFELTDNDLTKESPADGINCGWYVAKPRR